MDDRTDDQRAADEQLKAAVLAVCEAYCEPGETWAPLEYVCIYSMTRWDDDGDQLSAVGTAVDGGTTPIHRLLGLTEYATLRYRKLITTDDDDG